MAASLASPVEDADCLSSITNYPPRFADEIRTPGEGQIKLMFTGAGNPVLSTPNGRAVDDAFEELDYDLARSCTQRNHPSRRCDLATNLTVRAR